MKNSIAFIPVALIIMAIMQVFSCKDTNQRIAENKAKEYLKSTLNDPNSYEPVSFSPLMPVYFCDKYQADITIAKYQLEADIDNKKYSSQLDSFKMLSEAIKNDSTITKYLLRHDFRATNKFGGVVTQEEIFEFDTNLAMITR